MFKQIVLITAATLLGVTIAVAQNNPPPANVNPGSMKSGAEQSGAENQPRSRNHDMGTTGVSPNERPATSGMQKNSSPDSTAGGAVGTRKDSSTRQ